MYVRLAYTSVHIRPYGIIGMGCSSHSVTKNSGRHVIRPKMHYKEEEEEEEEDSVELPGLYVQVAVHCYKFL